MAGDSAGHWLDLGPDFIRRVLLTTAWVGGIGFLCIAAYVGIRQGAAWAAGVALGAGDLYLLSALIREALRGRRRWALVLFGFLKFAGVYAVGGLFLFGLRLAPWFLLAGFSLFLGIALLKVLGRLVLASPAMQKERHGAGGPLLRNSPGGGKAGR